MSVFLQNKSEWLVNSKGRRGYLIYRKTDKHPLYVFQPIDISDSHASIYDRTALIPARRVAVPVLLTGIEAQPSVVVEPPTQAQVPGQEVPGQGQGQVPGQVPGQVQGLTAQEHIDTIQTQINQIMMVPTASSDLPQIGYIRTAMSIVEKYFKIDNVACITFRIHRYIDSLDLKSKVDLLTLVSNKPAEKLPVTVAPTTNLVLVQEVQRYFEERTVSPEGKQKKNTNVVVLADSVQTGNAEKGTAAVGTTLGNNHVFMYQSSSSTSTSTLSWEEIPMEDAIEYHPYIKTHIENELGEKITTQFIKEINEASQQKDFDNVYNIGFYSLFKHEVVLKARNLLGTRVVPGAVIFQEGKQITVARIRSICHHMNVPMPPDAILEDPVKPVIDLIYDFICRHFAKQGTLLYLTREQVIGSNIDRFEVATETIMGVTRYVLKNKKTAKKGKKGTEN